MASMKRFWQSIAERTTCAACGNEELSLQRSHHEARGDFWCSCGAEGTYHNTNRSTPDYTTGAIRTEPVEHRGATR